jgi:23S rRNA pseudouridine1911/1915/1917 synthase
MDVLFENRYWLAINKPAGLIVERNPFEEDTIETRVWDYLSASSRKPFLGIVHRLDRVTSGVLVLAKKKAALKHLNRQFQERSIQKTYLAVTTNLPFPESSPAKHWLLKDQKDKRAVIYPQPNQKAVEVSLSYSLLQKSGDYYWLEVEPHTGKFHQIRAQLAFMGAPIVGDEKYGSERKFAPKAIALHASRLKVIDPLEEKEVILEAPVPEKWNQLFL